MENDSINNPLHSIHMNDAELNNLLTFISTKIVISNKNGKNDFSKDAEIVMKNIFELLYQTKFDTLSINAEAIDLYSKECRIAVQVTSNKKPKKIQNTILKFKQSNDERICKCYQFSKNKI